LGHGKYENTNLPKRIEIEGNAKAVKVSAGKQHSFILDNKSFLRACGWNVYGQLGVAHN
jgi:alpha-tubulin suppressor-like RCC1 family protein